MTSAAHPSPQPHAGERRTTNRAVAVLRMARLVTDADDQLCVVRNMSPTGLMIDATVPPDPGSIVWVEFSTSVKVRGTVRWGVDYRFGIEFDTAEDILPALDQVPSRLRRNRSRAPRFTRAGTVRVVAPQASFDSAIVNISLNGLRLRATDSELTAGASVALAVPGLAKRDGRVRWVRAGVAGIWFDRPLLFRDLALWLTAEQRGD